MFTKARELADARRAPATSFDEPAETAIRRDDIREVRGCLLTLTELQRQAVVLAFCEGYSYPEVAEIFEAKVPAVKAQIRDGLLRLKHCLRAIQQPSTST